MSKTWIPQELPGAWGRESLKALTAEPWTQRELPVGEHALQLYSLGTPNGIKVTIMLEELDIEYDAWFVDIRKGDQFTSGFMAVNPNAMIPCLVDRSDPEVPIRLFESNAILLHLAEKHRRFIPSAARGRAECLSWLMWQASHAPYLGVYHHYFLYTELQKRHKDSVDRWTLEVKRQFAVLDRHLANRAFLCGEEVTIADFAVYAWVHTFQNGEKSEHVDFANGYPSLLAWALRLGGRPAVQRGTRVNAMGNGGLRERHSRSDFGRARL